MLPDTTPQAIAFLFRDATPAFSHETDCRVTHDPTTATTRIAVWNRTESQPTEAEIVAAAASPEFDAWLADRTDPAKNAKRLARIEATNDTPQTMVLRALLKKIIRPALKRFEDVIAAYKTEIVRLGGNPANLPDPPQIRVPAVLIAVVQDAINKGHGAAARLGNDADE